MVKTSWSYGQNFVVLWSKLRGPMVKTLRSYGQNFVVLRSKLRGAMVKTSWSCGQNFAVLWSKLCAPVVKTWWSYGQNLVVKPFPGASRGLPEASQDPPRSSTGAARGPQEASQGGSAGVFRNMVRGWGGEYERDRGLRCVVVRLRFVSKWEGPGLALCGMIGQAPKPVGTRLPCFNRNARDQGLRSRGVQGTRLLCSNRNARTRACVDVGTRACVRGPMVKAS